MSVKMEIGYHMQQCVDNLEVVNVKGGTIKECLDELVRQYPAMKEHLFDSSGELMVILLHQGDPVVDGTINNKVKDGDVIGVYPVIIGG